MCWQVLDWNSPAIAFYKKYNSEISNDWLNGKLTKQQIENFKFQFKFLIMNFLANLKAAIFAF